MADRARHAVPPPFQVYWDARWDRPPWQVAAAWAGLCGFFLARPSAFTGPWWMPLLVAVLVDPLWGAWWRLATREPQGDGAVPALPYARPDAPWALWPRVVAPGTVTGFLLVGVAAAVVVHFLGANSLWPTLLAAALALTAWWTSRAAPRVNAYLEPVYALGLPLWAGAYIRGAWHEVAWLAAALVALAWAQAADGRARVLWGLVGLSLWGWGTQQWMPAWLVGLSLIGCLISAFAGDAARGRVVWWALLLGTVASRWLLQGGS